MKLNFKKFLNSTEPLGHGKAFFVTNKLLIYLLKPPSLGQRKTAQKLHTIYIFRILVLCLENALLIFFIAKKIHSNHPTTPLPSREGTKKYDSWMMGRRERGAKVFLLKERRGRGGEGW